MYISSVFVNDIIIEIFGLNPTSEDYRNIGGIKCDRNIFYYCISRKTKYLNDTCAIALKALMLREIENNSENKKKLFEYFKLYLPKDVNLYLGKNPSEIGNAIDLAISKFTSPNDNISIEEPLKTKVKPIITDISELYIKTVKYLNEDKVTAFNLLYRTIEKIIGYIKQRENLNFLENSLTDERTIRTIEFKHIMPESVLFTIKEINHMTNINDSTSAYKDFLKIIFTSITNIVKWFIKDYLEDALEFTIAEHKAEQAFYYNKYKDEVKVCTIEELKNMGWNMRDIAKAVSDFIDKSMNESSPEDSTGIELLLSKIELHPESRRVLLDGNNEIIGYWNFVPLKDKYFKLDKEGNLPASEMLPYTMPEYMVIGRHNIHFGTTCLKKVFRKTYTFKKLLFSIIEFIEKLALEGVFIDEIVTDAVSDSGIALSESLGFKYYKDAENGTAKVYHAYAKDLVEKPYLKDFELLKKLYRNE